MKAHSVPVLLAAAWLVASTACGFAENGAQPTPDVRAAPASAPSTRRPDKVRNKHAASHRPAERTFPAISAPTGEAAERAASLERRRKAFFANQPDSREPTGDLSSAPVGVTLGGSGGLTPEMGMKF